MEKFYPPRGVTLNVKRNYVVLAFFLFILFTIFSYSFEERQFSALNCSSTLTSFDQNEITCFLVTNDPPNRFVRPTETEMSKERLRKYVEQHYGNFGMSRYNLNIFYILELYVLLLCN